VDTDLGALRRYTRTEAAAMLNIPDHWLRDWVSQHRVPHQRKGARGVWFTLSDIRDIGGRLPSLMSPQRANARAEHADGHGAAVPVRVGAMDDDVMARFAGLRSARR
jgi:hypothetical protein